MLDSEIVMSLTLEPRDPYPLPIPELLAPVALILELATTIDPAVEKPLVQYPLPSPLPCDELVAVTFELTIVISPIVELPSLLT
jgi:hypothetical protein